MRRPRYIDFVCPACGNAEERFIETNDDGSSCEPQKCEAVRTDVGLTRKSFEAGEWKDRFVWADFTEELPKFVCIAVMEPTEIGVGYLKTIVKGNGDFNERERERLEKRSLDHWNRQGKDEAVDRQRTLLNKYAKQSGL